MEPVQVRAVLDAHLPSAALLAQGDTCYPSHGRPSCLGYFVATQIARTPVVSVSVLPTTLATHRAVSLAPTARHQAKSLQWVCPLRPCVAAVVGPVLRWRARWHFWLLSRQHFARALPRGGSFHCCHSDSGHLALRRLWEGWTQPAAREMHCSAGNQCEDFGAPLRLGQPRPPTPKTADPVAVCTWCRRRASEVFAATSRGPLTFSIPRVRRSLAWVGTPLPHWAHERLADTHCWAISPL